MPLNATQQHILTSLITVCQVLAGAHGDAKDTRLGWDSEGVLATLNTLTQEEIDAIPDLAGLTAGKIANAVTSMTLFTDTIDPAHLNNLLIVARFRRK